MDYIDTNEYRRRTARVQELARLQPKVLQAMPSAERDAIERYFLGGAQADDPDEYRATVVKADPTIELAAERAYNGFLSAAGVNETLTDNVGDYEADLKRNA